MASLFIDKTGFFLVSSIALLSVVLFLALLLRLLEVKSSLSLSSNQLHPDGDEDNQEERDSKHLLGHDGVVNLEEGEVFPGENTGHLDNLDSFSLVEVNQAIKA